MTTPSNSNSSHDFDALLRAAADRALPDAPDAARVDAALEAATAGGERPVRQAERVRGEGAPRGGLRTSIIGVAVGVIGAVLMLVFRASPLSQRSPRYATHVAQQSIITLRDGTRVHLGPQTALEVDPTFGQGNRSIRLSGEASFEVVNATHDPFVVHTGAIRTRVLGTSFSVRWYSRKDTVQVVVTSGRVLSQAPRRSVVIKAGTVGMLTDSSVKVTPASMQQQYTDWSSGHLVFKRTPVPELLATLGRWYGYQFRLADSTIASKDVSAVFDIGDPAEMMKILQLVLDVSMTFHDRVVTLTPGRADLPGLRRSILHTLPREMGK